MWKRWIYVWCTYDGLIPNIHEFLQIIDFLPFIIKITSLIRFDQSLILFLLKIWIIF